MGPLVYYAAFSPLGFSLRLVNTAWDIAGYCPEVTSSSSLLVQPDFVLMSTPRPLDSVTPDDAKLVTRAPFPCPPRGGLRGASGKVSLFLERQARKKQPSLSPGEESAEGLQDTLAQHNCPSSAGPPAASFYWVCLPRLLFCSCLNRCISGPGPRPCFLGIFFRSPVLDPLSSSFMYSFCRSIFFRGLGNRCI